MQQFVPPMAEERQWAGVKRHLTGQLRLPAGLVDRLHQQGLVYATGAGKVAFLLRDLEDRSVQGAMLYDLEIEDYAIIEGSREDAYFYLGNGARAVVVENPVEAMSKWVLEQPGVTGHYLAVLPSQDWPQDWLAGQGEVVVALGRGDVADGVWPIGASWNQDLRDWVRVRFEPEQQRKRGRQGIELD